jgi:gentisate 1,2-dioxygenase
MEASYHINGDRQTVVPGHGEKQYGRSGILPSPVFERSKKAYPMLRYAWSDAKAALVAMAEDEASVEAVQITYVNPETGGDAENILGFYALMLRPGQTLRLPARSPAQVFHVIEGSMEVKVLESSFILVEADTCCAPGYESVTLMNLNAGEPTFIFMADESPLHRKLGVYENRG